MMYDWCYMALLSRVPSQESQLPMHQMKHLGLKHFEKWIAWNRKVFSGVNHQTVPKYLEVFENI